MSGDGDEYNPRTADVELDNLELLAIKGALQKQKRFHERCLEAHSVAPLEENVTYQKHKSKIETLEECLDKVEDGIEQTDRQMAEERAGYR